MQESEFPLGEPQKITLVQIQPGTRMEELAKNAATTNRPQSGQLIKSVND
jgi:predicted Zn-dependent protease